MKSIYEEALEDLSILVKQANARKLSNDIVASRWGVERITKIIEQSQKQEELLSQIKEIVDRNYDTHFASTLADSIRYNEIKKLIKELENE